MADLNDTFRRSFSGGQVVLTAGIAPLREACRTAVLAVARSFDAFGADNDPHGEHDFGEVASGEVPAFWKIDAYDRADRALSFPSPDPADSAVTVRVLTVMLAEEY